MRPSPYIFIAVIVALSHPGGLSAQSGSGLISGNADHAVHPFATPGPVVGADLVDERFRPVAYHANALRRTVYRTSDGRFQVRVVSASGTLRLEGSYLDEELQMPHGPFTYYHPSGQLESSGLYDHGVKAGVWERGSWDGVRLAERVYTGLCWDDLQVHLGLATRAVTLASIE